MTRFSVLATLFLLSPLRAQEAAATDVLDAPDAAAACAAIGGFLVCEPDRSGDLDCACALAGKASDAYFVKVDRETTTQNSSASGRLLVARDFRDEQSRVGVTVWVPTALSDADGDAREDALSAAIAAGGAAGLPVAVAAEEAARRVAGHEVGHALGIWP